MSLNFRPARLGWRCSLSGQADLLKPVHIGFRFSLLSRNASDVSFVPLITAPQKFHVRFGSLAAAARSNCRVRFTPESCRDTHWPAWQLRAISGHSTRSASDA